MGSILSGSNGWRGGKMRTDELPEVRLTSHALCKVKISGTSPTLVLEGNDWAIVSFGFKQWAVALDTTPLLYGGSRRWLCCPSCGGRRVSLYIRGKELACRQCLNLTYRSQLENDRSRLTSCIDKIRERLGWKLGPLNPEGGKPKGMHWRTYHGLRRKHDALMHRLLGGLSQWLDGAEKVFGRAKSEKAPIRPPEKGAKASQLGK